MAALFSWLLSITIVLTEMWCSFIRMAGLLSSLPNRGQSNHLICSQVWERHYLSQALMVTLVERGEGGRVNPPKALEGINGHREIWCKPFTPGGGNCLNSKQQGHLSHHIYHISPLKRSYYWKKTGNHWKPEDAGHTTVQIPSITSQRTWHQLSVQ